MIPDPEFLLQAGLSNAVLAVILAVIAFAVQRHGKSPQLAHMLWLLVLLKLLTPPLMTIPVSSMPLVASTPVVTVTESPTRTEGETVTIGSTLETMTSGVIQERAIAMQPFLLVLWLMLSASFACYSITRVARFNRLLNASETQVPQELVSLTVEVASELSLAHVPSVHVTTARVSPMIWSGFRPRLYLPLALTERLDVAQLRCVIAHELSHVKRGDHFIRWIEWLAMVLFFWHPLLWVARRGLHQAEEMCCDQMVIEMLNPVRKDYALTIARTVRLLVQPLKAPEMASPINGGHQLQRRIDMMLIPTNAASRPSRFVLFVFAAAMLPLGLLRADSESDYQAMQERLDAAVLAGDITPLQADERRQAFLRRQQEVTEPESETEATEKRERIREIRAAHHQGHLTDEEFREALRAAGVDMSKGGHHARAKSDRSGIERRMRRIRAAQAEGKMTDEEAKAAIRRVRLAAASVKQEHGERSGARGEHNNIKDCPETATEIGNCSAKADEMFGRMREIRISQADGNLTAEQAESAYRQLLQDIRDAVESGEMTENDGRRASRRIRVLLP